jgi:hypothetical protein
MQRQSADLAKRQTSIVSITHDQLGQAVAEIERAAAALRQAEPALELGIPRSIPAGEVRNYRSVWIMIGALWISATLVVVGATGAILYLLG